MIVCEHPVIIKNPNIPEHYTHIYIRGKYSLRVPSPKSAKIERSDLDSCYFLDSSTGEVIPCYIEVPCGKCIICRNRKSKEWQIRAQCETLYSKTVPLFITLTYNEHCVDLYHGLYKRHLQLFLKRLRINLERSGYEDVNLRYIACGEYGKNTQRPHYHLIVWNFPRMQNWEVVNEFISKAWSRRVSKEFYNELAEHERFTSVSEKGLDIYYLKQGFVYVKPSDGGIVRYITKYMRKVSTPPPSYDSDIQVNDVFFLSSRRRGIGYQYAIENAQFFRTNTREMQIEIMDKFTGQRIKGCIPLYFKRIWYPTKSMMFPKPLRDALSQFDFYASALNYLRDYWNECTECSHFDIDYRYMIKNINSKYRLLGKFGYDSLSSSPVPKLKETFTAWNCEILYRKDEFLHYCYEFYTQMCFWYYLLLRVDYSRNDECIILNQLKINQERKADVMEFCLTLPEVNVKDVAYSLKKRELRETIREAF